jgi:hypothetical protein
MQQTDGKPRMPLAQSATATPVRTQNKRKAGFRSGRLGMGGINAGRGTEQTFGLKPKVRAPESSVTQAIGRRHACLLVRSLYRIII